MVSILRNRDVLPGDAGKGVLPDKKTEESLATSRTK